MYILIHQHDNDRLVRTLAYGVTYLEEVLATIGKPVSVQGHMPEYYWGYYVYKINWGDNPTLELVAHHADSSD